MDDLIYYLVSGLCAGAIYSLIALGYTLVYGIIKLINFAHGEFMMVGAYAGLGLYLLLPPTMTPWLSAPVVVLGAGAAGAIIAVITERIAYRPIRDRGRLAALLTAIGVSFLLQNLATFIENGSAQTYHGPLGKFSERYVTVGGSGVLLADLAYIPISLALMLGLWHMVRRTRFGKAMRATSQDLTAARLMGIDTDGIIRNTFLLGGFFAGVAGALLSLTTNLQPQMGFMPGLNAFVAAVVGGIGSIPGALIGGYVLGLVQYLVMFFGIDSAYKDVASFLLLILVLLLRPEGILGRRSVVKV